VTDGTPTEVRGTRVDRSKLVSHAPPVVFVGGTGRSGTHIIARLLSKHPRLALVPVEVRFHVDEGGFPGLLAGTVSKQDFVRRLRGFWWKGFQTRRMRGLFRFVERERFEQAVERFEGAFDVDPHDACRNLFFDLLWFRTTRADEKGRGPLGIVEQSCDTVAEAGTLMRLFPEAKFIHVVRDGRDASASRVAQTHGLVRPRTRRQGLRWWEERLRRIDAGARAVPPDRLLTVSLDELVLLGGDLPAIRPICSFLDVYPQRRMKRYFRERVNAELANAARWRRGISGRRAARLEQAYEEIVAGLEADGVLSAPLLRRTLERSRAPDPAALEPKAFVSGTAAPPEAGS
jgi:transposase-like protein